MPDALEIVRFSIDPDRNVKLLFGRYPNRNSNRRAWKIEQARLEIRKSHG